MADILLSRITPLTLSYLFETTVVGTAQNKSTAVPAHGSGSKKYRGTGTVLGTVLFKEL